MSTKSIKTVAVLGAGTMGNGIAHVFAQYGFPVVLTDVRAEFLDRALATIAANLDRQVKKGTIQETAKALTLGKITTSTDLARAAAGADIVIEAVTEDLTVKTAVFATLDTTCKPGAILASNTSSISVTGLAALTRRPEHVIGMHFMNPVPVMPLVEVIRGKASSEETVASVVAFALKLGKTPIVVKDGPGFLVNRVLGPYMQNAFRMLEEAIQPETIDAAMESFGMPMGPIELADAVGLDICLAAGKELAKKGASGEAEAPKVLLSKVALGKLGKKTGQGIYHYVDGKTVKRQAGEPRGDMVASLIEPSLAEARAVLAEGIVADADLIDAGLIFGTGFAPFRGGPLHYLESKREQR